MDEQAKIVSCPACGAKNRVPAAKTGAAGKRPVCGRCKTPLPVGAKAGKATEVTDADFANKVLASPVPVMVDCWAPWCGPCRTVGPVVDALAAEWGQRVAIFKLNVDNNPATASRYNISGIPTLLFFKAGKEVDRLVGAAPRSQMEARLKSLG
ncbi:MAG: thioredoxin [Desulfatibacillaceae bacterium]|nr:thioredoxin [Desulfatibacillaceae bacterium]